VWAPLEDALALLAGLELGERDREAVLWRNAARLFHLERLE